MLKVFLSIILITLGCSLTSLLEAATDVSIKKELKPQALLQLKVVDVHETWLEDKKVLSLVFSHNLVEGENYNSFLTVTENGVSLKGHWIQAKKPNCLYLKNIKPENKYEIFIRPGIKSETGLKLLQPKHFNVMTKKVEAESEFLDKGKTLSIKEFAGINVRSSAVTHQEVSVYHLDVDKYDDFIQKLQQVPNLNSWKTEDIAAVSTLINQTKFNIPASQRLTKKIKLEDINTDLQQGLYFVLLKAMTSEGKRINRLSYFNLSDFDASLDNLSGSLAVLTVSMQDTKFSPKAKLKLITPEKILKKKADKNGFANFSQDEASHASWLWVSSGTNSHGILKNVPYKQKSYDNLASNTAQLFLSKKTYKIGDRVDFSVLLRNIENKAMVDQVLHIVLLDPDARVVSEQRIATPELGVVSGFFQLPEESKEQLDNQPQANDTKNKPWRVNVYLNDQEGEPLSSSEFYIDEIDYLDARLHIVTEASFISSKSKVAYILKGFIDKNIPIKATPVVIQRSIRWQQKPSSKYKDFQFGIPSDKVLEGNEVMQTLSLDSKGLAEFILPKIKNNINSVLSVEVQGEMQRKGTPIAIDSKVLAYWPASSMIGIRSLQWGSEDVEAGVTFEIININQSNHLLAAKNLQVKVIELAKETDWKYASEKGWYKEKNDTETIIDEKSLSFVEGDIGKLNFTLEKGNYRLEITNPETNLRTELPFSIGQATRANNLNPEDLRLSLDKKSYKPNEEAILTIESAFSGEAIVKLESDKVHYIDKVQLSKGITQIKIPLDKKYKTQNLELTVLGLHHQGQHFFKSHGVISLPIGVAVSDLFISIDSDKNTVTLHSDEYKNVMAVVVITRKTEPNKQLLPEITPLVQTVMFDDQGNATVNNIEEKIRSNQHYNTDLYFIDSVVNNVKTLFSSNTSPLHQTEVAH